MPYWLREVPDVYFRTNNEPFKEHTERYVRKILGMMKEEKLFASQGGPIILGQVHIYYTFIIHLVKAETLKSLRLHK